MKHLTAFAFVFLFTLPAQALEVPALRARVTDLAGLLDSGTQATLEAKLKAHEQATTQQFALLIVQSLEGDPIEDYSIRVVEAWKLGSEKEDSGLLMLIVLGDRKMRIEVGHGLEGAIPDAIAARVIRNVLTPAFRAQDFAGGINEAFGLLMRAGGGEVIDVVEVAPPAGTSSQTEEATFTDFLIFLLFIILPILFNVLTGRPVFSSSSFGSGGYSSGGGGGGFSGGGGSFGGGGASGSW